MEIKEFRGCRGLVFAEVITDNNETDGGYVVGDVKPLAGSAEISKTVETASEARYYDNLAKFVINSEGADTVTFTISVPDDAVLADITGRVYDAEKKAYIEAPRKNKYFAVGYIIGEKGATTNDERFVWRMKGTFAIPDETSATEDSGTSANNMSLVFSGVYTEHKFTNGGGTGVAAPVKAWYIRESDGVATEEQFFDTVATPDSTFGA